MEFTKAIIHWYKKNKRELPWRNIRNPYFIWLSEIILQQTRVEQGIAYYLNFTREFPDIKKLASASEEKIMKLWQGLGYYSRARNLHATAKQIVKEHNGKFPSTYTEIIKLKGVGPYTAAAIASIAFNKPHAVVDGNAFRVLARVFGIKTPIDSTQGKKEFYELANELIDKEQPALFNQAIMEFGATYCKPRNPDCENCIFSGICVARNKKIVDRLPIKTKFTKVRNRYFNYIIMRHKNTIVIKKRTGKDIWKNLYDFPLIETDKELRDTEVVKTSEWKALMGKNDYSILSVSKTYKHVLSHQIIFARFWEVQTKKSFKKFRGHLIVTKQHFHKYPIPRLIDIYLYLHDKNIKSIIR
ncbi:MAG: A/G-specific adenine glycosylase [Bacteroidia bacterium]|nr:A/G-specific adenine glycosylase [Bacteroidia bacterium]